MTPMDAIYSLRALVAQARQPDPDLTELTVPIGVADAITLLAGEPPDVIDDLLVLLAALDLRDCSAGMIRDRGIVSSRLRLDPTDRAAEACARDLIATADVRRRLRIAMEQAAKQRQWSRVNGIRLILLAADRDIPGWRVDAANIVQLPLRLAAKDHGPMLLGATRRLLNALAERADEGVPFTVTLSELALKYRGPSPAVAARVLADDLFGQMVRHSIDARWRALDVDAESQTLSVYPKPREDKP